MTGSATFARSRDVAAAARERLDRTAEVLATMEAAQRTAIAALLDLWPTSAWLAAGARSAKAWLLAYSGVSEREAQRLERIAALCHDHRALADAVLSGQLNLRRAERLAVAVTDERAPFLADSLPALLELNRNTTDEAAFGDAVRFWVGQVDQHLEPHRVPPHAVVLSQRLFGGGTVHADLAPAAFENVAAGIDAWTQDPDPTDAPYRRTLSERRADALDDLTHFARTHHDTDTDGLDDDPNAWDEIWARDTFDGTCPTDTLDEARTATDDCADSANEGTGQGLDPLVLLRRQLRRAEEHRRRRGHRRTRARSGVVMNVHIDLRTISALRDHTDLQDLVLRGEGWAITQQVAEQLLCDSALVTTLFDGTNRILDANDAAEQFSRRQRRALAARDRHCVFPSCTRPPQWCDAHHLHFREHHGPTRTDNGALLCRFHHRLIHQHRWQLTIEDGHWIATDPHGHHWTGRPAHLPLADADNAANADGRPPDQPGAKTNR